ncbi:MAG: hypothetical protein IJU30_01060 [Lachnospiraceae bacterium]|nr:hypothetical protein [Lachnospiraceae bacterium]
MFLLELIIAIGFFAVAGIVCINMFLHAHRISVAAEQKTEAVRIAQNCAESFIAADGDSGRFMELLQAAFPEDKVTASGDDVIAIISDDSVYETALQVTEMPEDGDMQTLLIRVGSAEDAELFALEVKDYISEGGGHEQ